MSEFDKFAATYAEKAFNTKKTYNNAYKKLYDSLDQKDIHTCTSQEIFDQLDKYESARRTHRKKPLHTKKKSVSCMTAHSLKMNCCV